MALIGQCTGLQVQVLYLSGSLSCVIMGKTPDTFTVLLSIQEMPRDNFKQGFQNKPAIPGVLPAT